MRILLPAALLWPIPALSHPGHLADVMGHGHWVAGAAIAIGLAIAAWGALKGRGADAPEDEDEPEDQPA
ncbi:MAG: DUF6732 family protein [Paracoccaceae bacterium]